jgi:trehalose/maltose hydrolase-like predicted phosphorylase
LAFIKKQGAEMFFEICRFWASKAELNKETGRYSIAGVMGPDEFHEQYHGAAEGGLRDNAYTNIMVAWAFDKAFDLLEKLGNASKAILQKLDLKEEELNYWKKISQKLNIVISDEGIISQYDGYFDLKELDWEGYLKKYDNIYRLDRILKAEGKSADEFKVAKQADTLMTFYNLDDEEVRNILQKMGYAIHADFLKQNMSYYLGRTSHGSTLSRVVHALLANMTGDRDLSWELYQDALGSDYVDIQGGTTAEGIHLGVMAGTVLIAMHAYAGVNLRGDIIRIEPNMPKAWRRISFGFSFQGQRFRLKVGHHGFSMEHAGQNSKVTQIMTHGKTYRISPGHKLTVDF